MKMACNKALAYEGVQRLNEEKFDLVLLYTDLTDCFLSFAHKLKVPFIYMSSNKFIGTYSTVAASPAFPSLEASFLLDLEYPLTFTGRMISTLYDLLDIMFKEWKFIPR
ncbi:hypothetical protein E2C01_090029 [Portunus trituberculatus]|uniref:Uncharacterized protein n=1 Tax=Portunus trituberculatus TaxID=210409 RepID=A0A5B7JAD6_PORTR|nr:hypothetical protein [Portunus trituberculatus]